MARCALTFWHRAALTFWHADAVSFWHAGAVSAEPPVNPAPHPSDKPAFTGQTPPRLAGIDADPLRSNVPRSTHVLLVGIMLLFFVVLTLITLQAAWMWWLIPVVLAVPVVAVLVERSNRVLKSREAARVMEAELRGARVPGYGGGTGR